MHPPRISPVLFTALLFIPFISIASTAASAVLGIDFGQEYIKAALVKPGIPLEIVLTKDTKRKEVAAIGFKPSGSTSTATQFAYPERLYGADAVNLAARFPHDVYSNLKQIFGKSIMDETVSKYSKRYPALNLIPASGRNTVTFRSTSAPNDNVFSVEELVAMELKAIAEQAQAMAGPGTGKITDVMFTVPAFFSGEEKLALTTAAGLAGLKVMGYVSDGLAVGINYATSRTFGEEAPEYHIVYDMGAGSTTASVVSFQGKSVKDVGKFNKTVQEVSLTGVGYDKTLGGNIFNEKIFELLLTDFVENPKTLSAIEAEKDPKKLVSSNGRASAKLWKEATRVRQILSANSEAYSSVESLFQDIDFKSKKLTRSAFEEQITVFEDRIGKPIYDALAQANIELSQVSTLILHGGGVRTPYVQRRLEEIMGGQEKISKNVNPDEAAVFGATFKGAGESGSFRVKEIRTSDINPYGISIKYTKSNTDGGEKDITEQIFRPGSSTGKEKIATFPLSADFTFHTIHTLPPRPNDPKNQLGKELLSAYTTMNVTEALKELHGQYGCESKDISIRFSFSLSKYDALPVATSSWAECEIEIAAEGEKKEGILDGVKGMFGIGKKENEQPLMDESSESSSTTASPASDASPEPSLNESPEVKLVKRTQRSPIAFTVRKDGQPAIGPETLKHLKAKISGFDAFDASRYALEEARNELEAFTYKSREQLSSETFISASTDKEREQLSSKLEEAAEWLYGAGVSADRGDVTAKLKWLKTLYDPVVHRIRENEERPMVIKQLQDAIAQSKSLIEILKAAIPDPSAASSSTTTMSSSDVDDFADLEPSTSTTSTSTAPSSPEAPLQAGYSLQDLAGLAKDYEDVEIWLQKKLDEQESLEAWQDPVLTGEEIKGKLQEMEKLVTGKMKKLMGQPKGKTGNGKETRKDAKKDQKKESKRDKSEGKDKERESNERKHDEL